MISRPLITHVDYSSAGTISCWPLLPSFSSCSGIGLRPRVGAVTAGDGVVGPVVRVTAGGGNTGGTGWEVCLEVLSS